MCGTYRNSIDNEHIENIDDLKQLIEYSLFLIYEIRDNAKKLDQLNEQYYIDWEMELNRVSVADPNM